MTFAAGISREEAALVMTALGQSKSLVATLLGMTAFYGRAALGWQRPGAELVAVWASGGRSGIDKDRSGVKMTVR